VKAGRPVTPEGGHPLSDVYGRPGFMIRRAHQIAAAIFAEECVLYNLTTTQHGVLRVVSRMPGVDQTGIGRLMGLDKSTVAVVVRNLEGRRLLERLPDEGDSRRRHIQVTSAGARLLGEVNGAIEKARKRLLAPLTSEEQKVFMRLLGRVVDTYNHLTPAPIDDRPILEAALRDRRNHLRKKRGRT
jgi:DNA-binding MarR family transcriptional regulator